MRRSPGVSKCVYPRLSALPRVLCRTSSALGLPGIRRAVKSRRLAYHERSDRTAALSRYATKAHRQRASAPGGLPSI